MIDRLLVRLIGDGSSYQKMINAAKARTAMFEKQLSKVNSMMKGLGSTATRLGKLMTVAFTLPVIGIGVNAVRQFASFDDAMTKSTSIMKVTDKQIQELRNTALELSSSGEFIQTPREMAESYFFLASAGLDAQRSMDALPVVAKFATAGAFDMALATDLLTDAQTAMGMSGETAAESLQNLVHISDVFVRANQSANTSVQQVSEAMTADAGTAARQMGQSLESVVAVLEAYASAGKKGAEAGNLYGRATRLLVASAQKHEDEFKKLGIRVVGTNGEFRDFIDIIGDMEKAFKGMTKPEVAKALNKLGFKALAQKSITPLLGLNSVMEDYRDGVLRAGKATQEVSDKQLTSFAAQIKITRNILTTLSIMLGDRLAPTLLKINDTVLKLIATWKGLDEATRRQIEHIIVHVAALGPLLFITGKLLSVFTSLLPFVLGVGSALLGMINPIVLAIAAIAGLIAIGRWLMGSWEELGKTAWRAFTFIQDATAVAMRVMGRAWVILFGWLVAKFEQVFTYEFWRAIWKGIQKASELFNAFVTWARNKLTYIWTGSETGSLEDALKGIGLDFTKGFETQDLAKTLGEVFSEGARDFARMREGQSILSPEGRQNIGQRVEPLKRGILNAGQKTQQTLDQVSKNTKDLVDILKKEAEKNDLVLGPTALQ